MIDFMHAPGFLGTKANFAADMTLVLSLLVAILFTYGFYLARNKEYDRHKWVQTIGAAVNLVLVLWLMVLPYRDFVIRDKGGPRPEIFYYVTTIHAAFGFIAFFFGNFVVLRGHNLMPKFLQFNNYKLFMRIAYAFYITTTFLGACVYTVWFVVIENTPLF